MSHACRLRGILHGKLLKAGLPRDRLFQRVLPVHTKRCTEDATWEVAAHTLENVSNMPVSYSVELGASLVKL